MFVFLGDKEKVPIFLAEAIPGSPRVQHNIHLPTILATVANARPDPGHGLDGIWRICALKTIEPLSKRRRKGGEEYELDCTVYADRYKTWYHDELRPAAKLNMPRLRSNRVVVQLDKG